MYAGGHFVPMTDEDIVVQFTLKAASKFAF